VRAAGHLAAWVGLFGFWLLLTRDHQPTWPAAVAATGLLVGTFASAVYWNHLVLIPALWRSGRRAAYWAALAGSVGVLTIGVVVAI